jgi:hypothetical protein
MTKAQPTPKQLMASAQRMLADAASHWDDFHASIEEVLEIPIGSSFSNGGRSSDISDPTSSAALAQGRLYWSTKLSDAEAQAVEVNAAVKNLLRMMSARPVMAVDPKLKALWTCAEDKCGEFASKAGLCQSHYDAKRYADKKTEVQP